MAKHTAKGNFGFFRVFIVVAVIAYFAFTGLFDKKSPTPVPVNETSTPLEVRPNWPFVEDSKSPVVADDLTRTNVYIVFDGSGSMNESGCSGGMTKLEAGKQALRKFAESLPPEINIGLLAFDVKGVSQRVSLSDIRGSNMRLEAAISGLRGGGGTPLMTAISQAYDKLTEQAKKQLGYGEYHMVVVTDGQASTAEDPSAIVNRMIAESPVILHTIGFCIDENHSLNQKGRTFYRTAKDRKSLEEGLESVLAEAPAFSISEFK